jgi:hypothetical protein
MKPILPRISASQLRERRVRIGLWGGFWSGLFLFIFIMSRAFRLPYLMLLDLPIILLALFRILPFGAPGGGSSIDPQYQGTNTGLSFFPKEDVDCPDPKAIGELAIAYHDPTARDRVIPLLKQLLPRANEVHPADLEFNERNALDSLVLAPDRELAFLAIDALVYVGDGGSVDALSFAITSEPELAMAAATARVRLIERIRAEKESATLLRRSQPDAMNPDELLRRPDVQL